MIDNKKNHRRKKNWKLVKLIKFCSGYFLAYKLNNRRIHDPSCLTHCRRKMTELYLLAARKEFKNQTKNKDERMKSRRNCAK